MPGENADHQATDRMTTTAVGAGAALVLVAGAAHGDLPEGSGTAALRFVAAHDLYALVHFVSILGGVSWALGLRGYPQLLHDPRARLLAHWASASALIGASVLAVQFSLDGFGLPAMAERFAEASPGSQAALGEVAETTAEVMIGLALLWVILLYGVTICLIGAADLREPAGARWIPSVGILVGGWTAVAALSVALGGTVVPDWLAFVSGIVGGNIWLIVWAASWRRRSRAAGVPSPDRHAGHRAAR